MTKENSAKPAFVSKETGWGDGFLAATHVWESSTLPPWAGAAAAAAAASAFNQWNATDVWAEDRACVNPAFIRKWRIDDAQINAIFSNYRQTRHHLTFIAWTTHTCAFFFTHPCGKNNINMEYVWLHRNSPNEFKIINSSMCVQPCQGYCPFVTWGQDLMADL